MGKISTNGVIEANNMFISNKQVLHTGNWSSYCAAASHTHNQFTTQLISFSNYGVTGSIGPLNSGWFHFNSSVPFYFDTSVFVNGPLAIYNANSRGCGSTFPSDPSTGQIFFKIS